MAKLLQNEKKKMKDDIYKLNKFQWNKIKDMIDEETNKYTIKNDGIYLRLNILSDDMQIKIKNYINKCIVEKNKTKTISDDILNSDSNFSFISNDNLLDTNDNLLDTNDNLLDTNDNLLDTNDSLLDNINLLDNNNSLFSDIKNDEYLNNNQVTNNFVNNEDLDNDEDNDEDNDDDDDDDDDDDNDDDDDDNLDDND